MLLVPTLECHIHLEEQHDCYRWIDFQLGIAEKLGDKAVSTWEGKSHKMSGEKRWWVKFPEIYFSVVPLPNPMNPTGSGSWSTRDCGQVDPFALAQKFPMTSGALILRFPLKWKVERSFCGKGSAVDCSRILIQCSGWSPIGHMLEVADDAELISRHSCHGSYFNIADLCGVVCLALHAFSFFSHFPCPNSSFPQGLFFSTIL